MKFKVGDLVEVTQSGHPDYEKGDKFTVKDVDNDGDVYDNKGIFVYAYRLKLVERNDEISELKETVSKLQSRVEQLGKLVEDNLNASTNEVFTYEDYKKLVREAKEFIVYHTKGIYIVNDRIVTVEFNINKDKNTVVALLKTIGFEGKVLNRGVAKCMKDDLFQEDIGKVIALGKLLGKDVSKFTNI